MTNVNETIEVEKNILYGGRETFNFDNFKSLGFLLLDLLKECGDKVALVDSVTEDEITYKQILNDSIEAAKCFRAAGLKVGDTIGIVSENRLEFPIPLLAALFVGVTVAPINATYTERELVHAFGLSRPKFIFTSPFPSYNVVTAASQTNFIQKIIQFGEDLLDESTILFADFIKQYKEPNPTEFIPAAVDIMEHNALVLCSSGTTGLPKGVQLTHFNLISTIALFKGMVTERNMNRDQPIEDSNILGIIPFFHAFGCLTLLGVCTNGAKLIVVPRFEEELYLSCIEKYKISVLFTVPPLMLFLAKHPLVDNYDLTSVEEIHCGAAPLSGETAAAVEKRFKNKVTVCQGYGLSETTLGVLSQRTNGVRKPGSVGILAHETYCKVVDPDTGKILGKNQAGELCFKGTQVMKGYIGNEEATRNTIDKDGWLHTGDIGYYDDDYHFYIVDRLKELIKYKAFQVPPAEIEAVLLTNAKIQDAAVIGLPDEASGELPLAFVVVQPNVKLTEKEVIKYVEDRVSAAKRLRGGVRFIDEIPKNISGKILRRELRALLAKSKL